MTYTTDLIGTGNTHVFTCINVKITTHFTAHPFISEIHMYDITCWIFIHILGFFKISYMCWLIFLNLNNYNQPPFLQGLNILDAFGLN